MKKVLIVALIVFAAVLLTAAVPSRAVAAGPMYHVVRPGQNLSGIAAMYGVSPWSVANANGLWNWNYVYVGQVLVIPYAGYPYSYARYYYPAYPVYYPRPTYGCYYWVRYGDTMTGIAARYGTNPWTLARANGIYNLNWIWAGQRLFIPGCN
ncbi:MAG: LysM peptidoglycan-binding domain-containing protein [Chloroflexota bacterium]|nr:LysM peptidoglycan-binding domain-containing protein [Chloroflexota bacterium]